MLPAQHMVARSPEKRVIHCGRAGLGDITQSDVSSRIRITRIRKPVSRTMEPRRLAPRASRHASQPSLGPPPAGDHVVNRTILDMITSGGPDRAGTARPAFRVIRVV